MLGVPLEAWTSILFSEMKGNTFNSYSLKATLYICVCVVDERTIRAIASFDYLIFEIKFLMSISSTKKLNNDN